MAERIKLVTELLNQRALRTEQQWNTIQPFMKPLVTSEAESLGRDVDELLRIIGVTHLTQRLGVTIEAARVAPRLAEGALSLVSTVISATAQRARSNS